MHKYKRVGGIFMNSPYSVPNASRQHFRNALKSKLFLALAILSAIYSVLSVVGLIVSAFAAGLEGDFSEGIGIVFPILSIIATVGLFTAYSAAKSDDSERIVSGLRMSKCHVASIVITLVLGYIGSVCLMIFAGGLAFIGDELSNHIPSEIIDEITPEIEEFISEFGDLTTAFIAFMFFIVGAIFLVLCILGTIYRRGISKAVKGAINAETTESSKAKISGFAIVFGYILGALIVIGGLDFSLMFDYSPLYVAIGIIDCISSIVLGSMIFIFSLILSSLRNNLSRVIPVVQRNCPRCGSPMPTGAAFCMHCGASPYTPAPQASQASEAPVNTAAPVSPTENAQSESTTVTEEAKATETAEEAPATVYCPSCGKPMPTGQAFCTNCGFKLN